MYLCLLHKLIYDPFVTIVAYNPRNFHTQPNLQMRNENTKVV